MSEFPPDSSLNGEVVTAMRKHCSCFVFSFLFVTRNDPVMNEYKHEILPNIENEFQLLTSFHWRNKEEKSFYSKRG